MITRKIAKTIRDADVRDLSNKATTGSKTELHLKQMGHFRRGKKKSASRFRRGIEEVAATAADFFRERERICAD